MSWKDATNAGRLTLPEPLLDEREKDSLADLTKEYEKIIEPGRIEKLAGAALGALPVQVKDAVGHAASVISEQEFYGQAMGVIADGFKVVEEQAARFSVNDQTVLNRVNGAGEAERVESLSEICILRAYDIAKAANACKVENLASAFVEGAATGAPGFAGIPFNLVLSTFLYYRAVQTVAMHYGFDVKNDAEELAIAGEVLVNALSPSGKCSGEFAGIIGKIMLISQLEVTKATAKKTWAAMVTKGGVPLLIAQMRALANAYARKALENAGRKGLEQSVFRAVFEQIGQRLTLNVVGKAVPVVSGAIGALFDTSMMNKVLNYADIFYHKRFILEKELRIEQLVSGGIDG